MNVAGHRPTGVEVLLYTSPALPGATHDITCARAHGLLDALARLPDVGAGRQGAPRLTDRDLHPIGRVPT